MARTRTSTKRKTFSADTLIKFKPDRALLANKQIVVETLVQALLEDDIDTFRDLLIAHLRTWSKSKLAKKTGLGRRTLYDLMDKNKFDPRLSTLSALLSNIAA